LPEKIEKNDGYSNVLVFNGVLSSSPGQSKHFQMTEETTLDKKFVPNTYLFIVTSLCKLCCFCQSFWSTFVI